MLRLNASIPYASNYRLVSYCSFQSASYVVGTELIGPNACA